MWSVEELTIQHQTQKVTVLNVKKQLSTTGRTDGLGLLYMGYQSVFLGRRPGQSGRKKCIDDEVDDAPPSDFQLFPDDLCESPEDEEPQQKSLPVTQDSNPGFSQIEKYCDSGSSVNLEPSTPSQFPYFDPHLETVLDTGAVKLVTQKSTDLDVPSGGVNEPFWVFSENTNFKLCQEIDLALSPDGVPPRGHSILNGGCNTSTDLCLGNQKEKSVTPKTVAPYQQSKSAAINLNSCKQFSIVHYENLGTPQNKSVFMLETQDVDQRTVRVMGTGECVKPLAVKDVENESAKCVSDNRGLESYTHQNADSSNSGSSSGYVSHDGTKDRSLTECNNSNSSQKGSIVDTVELTCGVGSNSEKLSEDKHSSEVVRPNDIPCLSENVCNTSNSVEKVGDLDATNSQATPSGERTEEFLVSLPSQDLSDVSPSGSSIASSSTFQTSSASSSTEPAGSPTSQSTGTFSSGTSDVDDVPGDSTIPGLTNSGTCESDLTSLLSSPDEEKKISEGMEAEETSLWDCIRQKKCGEATPEGFLEVANQKQKVVHDIDCSDADADHSTLVANIKELNVDSSSKFQLKSEGDKPAISYKAYKIDPQTSEVTLSKAKIATYLPLVSNKTGLSENICDTEESNDKILMSPTLVREITESLMGSPLHLPTDETKSLSYEQKLAIIQEGSMDSKISSVESSDDADTIKNKVSHGGTCDNQKGDTNVLDTVTATGPVANYIHTIETDHSSESKAEYHKSVFTEAEKDIGKTHQFEVGRNEYASFCSTCEESICDNHAEKGSKPLVVSPSSDQECPQSSGPHKVLVEEKMETHINCDVDNEDVSNIPSIKSMVEQDFPLSQEKEDVNIRGLHITSVTARENKDVFMIEEPPYDKIECKTSANHVESFKGNGQSYEGQQNQTSNAFIEGQPETPMKSEENTEHNMTKLYQKGLMEVQTEFTEVSRLSLLSSSTSEISTQTEPMSSEPSFQRSLQSGQDTEESAGENEVYYDADAYMSSPLSEETSESIPYQVRQHSSTGMVSQCGPFNEDDRVDGRAYSRHHPEALSRENETISRDLGGLNPVGLNKPDAIQMEELSSPANSADYEPHQCNESLTIYLKTNKGRGTVGKGERGQVGGAMSRRWKSPSKDCRGEKNQPLGQRKLTYIQPGGSGLGKEKVLSKTCPLSRPRTGLNQFQTVYTRGQHKPSHQPAGIGLNQLQASGPHSPKHHSGVYLSLLSPGGSTSSDDGSLYRRTSPQHSNTLDSSPGAYLLASYEAGSDFGSDSLLWSAGSEESLASLCSELGEYEVGHFPVYADWMKELPRRLHSVPLTSLAIPGSHISLAIERDLRTDMEISPCNYEMAEFLRKLPDLSIFNSFRSIIKRVWKAWMGKQMLAVTQQLYAGIRYLDIRVTKYRSALYAEHGLYSRQLPRYLKEIKLFLDSHVKEVVILHIGALNQINISDKRKFVTILFQVFGAKMAKCPKNVNETSLETLWRRKKQVIIIFPEEDVALLSNHIFAGLIWSDTLIKIRQHDTHDAQELATFLEKIYIEDLSIAQVSKRKTFHVIRAVLSPDMSLVFGDYHYSSMREMTLTATHPVVEGWIEGRKNVNIVACDFVGKGDMVRKVIELNSAKYVVETFV